MRSLWLFRNVGFRGIQLGSGKSQQHIIFVPVSYAVLRYSNRARPVDFDLSAAYAKNSLKIDSPEMQQICNIAASSKIAVVLGFSENFKDSLYIAQAIISAEGEIKVTRRKLKATHMERTIFGDASGASLDNVVDLPGIGRVGALACWEHTQPLLKYHTYHQNESIHVAAWPPVYEHTGGPGLYSMSSQGSITMYTL